MSQTRTRPLNDQPTTHRLLTTDEGKMYNLYILEPDGSTTVLDDDTIFFDWKDHCINPKAFQYLAEKHNCQITEHTLKHVHRQFLENYLNADSPLDVCIDDQLVRVNITNRGIDLYSYRLGIDRTFPTIKELNEFLVERGSPTYYTFNQDVKETWQQVTTPTKQDAETEQHFIRRIQDSNTYETVKVELLHNGEYRVIMVVTILTEKVYLQSLKEYYEEYSVVEESISELTLHNVSKFIKEYLAIPERTITKADIVNYLHTEHGIDFIPQ